MAVRFRFSLRVCLVLMLLVTIPLGCITEEIRRARQQKVAVDAITKLGGRVVYDYQVDDGADPLHGYHRRSPPPSWIRDAFGDNMFCCVVGVSSVDQRRPFSPNEYPAAFELALTGKTRRSLFTDEFLKHIGQLNSLRSLDLDNSHVSDAGVVHLAKLDRLEQLSLCNTQITDAGLLQFEKMKQLRFLDLFGTRTTDDGIATLQLSLPKCIIHTGGLD
jgi:hypothetical protein